MFHIHSGDYCFLYTVHFATVDFCFYPIISEQYAIFDQTNLRAAFLDNGVMSIWNIANLLPDSVICYRVCHC